MPKLDIKRLSSGGLITNYSCSSNCRHCLYVCSPNRKMEYMSAGNATKYLSLIRKMGCSSIHIGGGEPFLQPKDLLEVLKAARSANVRVDYIETNCSWFSDKNSADNLLMQVRMLGAKGLLISISPFHQEYTPLYKVDGVLNSCQTVGLQVFPWKEEFYQELSCFDRSVPHSIEELQAQFGDSYRQSIASRFWLQTGGRAVEFLKTVYSPRSSVDIASDRTGCTELLQTNHFHIDLKGNYIPGLCAGLSIRVEDLGAPLDEKKYPFITSLFNQGVGGLLDIACQKYGFVTGHEYLNKCHLCQEIRNFIVIEKGLSSIELQPVDFYLNL